MNRDDDSNDKREGIRLVVGGVLLAAVHGTASWAILTILFHMPYREAIATAYLIGGTAYFERAHAEHVARKAAMLLSEHRRLHRAHVVTESQCTPLVAPTRVSYVIPAIDARQTRELPPPPKV